MKYWLIEFIHSENNTLVVGKNIRRLWFICLIGIILIPSKEVLYKLL